MSISPANLPPSPSTASPTSNAEVTRAPRPSGGTPSGDGSGFADVLREAAGSIANGQTRIDRALRRGRRQDTSPAELLALQAGVYRFNQELELASKVVEKATGAVKTTLQSQQ